MTRASDAATVFQPPYRYEFSKHGPVTIYDAVEVGWIARVKESLPHKEALAAAMVDGLNHAAKGGMTEREGARLLTGGSSDEGDAGSIPAPSVPEFGAGGGPGRVAATTLRFAAKPYPTGRTKATGREVIVCYCGDGTWPHEWRPNGGGARIFACPSEAPIRKAES